MSLWSEIKQRRITQIVVTYVAGGWMALAVVDQVVDREVLPGVVYEVALTLYLFGILAALVVGWFHGEKGAQTAPRIEIATLVLIAGAAVATSYRIVDRSARAGDLSAAVERGDLRRLAVLYLEDVSADGALRAEADAITEALIGSLAEVRELDVSSRNAAREARDLLGSGVRLDSVARHLGVGVLVDGSLDRIGNELQVAVRLVEAETAQPLARQTFRWPADSLANVGDRLAVEVARELRETLGVEIRLRERQASAPNAAAWLHLARAERHLKDALAAVQHGDRDGTVRAFGAAEAELTEAREVAPDWADVPALHSRVAYERYVLAHSAEELAATLQQAIDFGDEALSIDPTHASALEWRGTARYRRWLARVDPDADRAQLLAGAEADLERARTLSPLPASVNSTLSHLYSQTRDWTEGVIAARNAYEQDPFLEVADGVLWRLATAYYDQGAYPEVVETCDVGAERFPSDFRFVQCRLLALTMPEATPDVQRAWQLQAELVPLLTERPEFFEAQSKVFVAGIIGRAGLADSANATFEAARVSRDVDPEAELISLEAAMRSVMGDVEGALEHLERFMIANGEHPPGESWWWRSIASTPEFQRYQNTAHD